ncbi:MAG: alpha-amylase family glycosyl hydrolase [Candidatus Cryosericum sp.]
MPAWLNDAVFYEIYPQSFCDTNADGIGDIQGITSKLGYIRDLGCNAVWINPCFVSPFKDGGYDIADYKTVALRYGTNEDLYRLFATAHVAGIHVLLDLVPGHTSDEHPWFQKSLLPFKNEYTNRYIWTDSAWTAPRDFHCVSGRFNRNGNYLVNFFSTQPALNYGFEHITERWQLPPTHPDCMATRAAMKDIMRFWLDKGCDGFRVDMADSLVKNDHEKKATSAIWQDVRAMFDSDYPEAVLVSEWSDPRRALTCGFHADFYLDHEDNGYHALFRAKDPANGKLLGFFSKQGNGNISLFVTDYLRRYEDAKGHGYISFITGNHDTPRMRRTLDETELKLAYAFIFTMPGVPFLYYGDEIGMRYVDGLVSKEGGYDRTGSRTPMQWSDGANHGFSDAAPDKLYIPMDPRADAPTVEAQARDPLSLLNTVIGLIHLRHAKADLQADGSFAVLYAEKQSYPFVYRRGELIVAVNPSVRAAMAPVNTMGNVLFSLGELPARSEHETSMAPQSFLVVET